MKHARRVLPLLLALAASPFLTHCGMGGCKGPLETPDSEWTPRLRYSSEGFKPFKAAGYPLGAYPNLMWSFELGAPRDKYDPTVVEVAPDRIRLQIWVDYSAAAVWQWRKDGYILGGDTTQARAGRFEYALVLDPRELKQGQEYVFNAADTSEGLHPQMTFSLVPAPVDGSVPTLANTSFTGYLRIEKDFTPKSGKFSFRMEAGHGQDQITVLAATVTMDGYEEDLNCGWN